MMHTHETAGYVPGMGRNWMLPLYDPLTRLLGVASFHRTLVDQADVQPGQRILEIGCGTGNLAILVKRRHRHADVVGLDPDAMALDRARRKAERQGLSMRWDQGFAESLPYADASFDRVLSALMLHHLGPDEKRAALREARRVLTPGGTLHLVDFGGATAPADGFMARRAHRNAMLRDNFGHRIPELMREAGFAEPAEVAHRVTWLLGRVTFYRAPVPSAVRRAV